MQIKNSHEVSITTSQLDSTSIIYIPSFCRGGLGFCGGGGGSSTLAGDSWHKLLYNNNY